MENTMTTTRKRIPAIPLFIGCVGGTMLLGFLSGWLSGSKTGYNSLVLPPATPPNIVFPVVWNILYAMMGVSLFLLYKQEAQTPALLAKKRTAQILWYIQFAMNLAYPFAFFALHWYTFSFLWLALLAAVNLAATIAAFRVSNLAGAMLIPYEAWLLFACYLNFFIALLNG